MGEPMIEARGVRRTYRRPGGTSVHACDGVDLTVDPGQVVALTGRSGSGKSTLLYLFGALETADAGSIVVAGRSVTELPPRRLPDYRRTVGFVFQGFHLLPALSVRDNVLAPVLYAGRRTRARYTDRADELLDLVGLADRAQELPSRLSGGQQQRVAVARALLADPPLVLADEPTGNLDSHTGDEVVDLLLSVRDQFGTTIVVATHDAELSARCDRTVRLSDGRVVAA
jgi:putative ABC transport system ATP-binding protein